MYLAELKVSNFRKIKNISMEFNPGLNIIMGENNIGKTAIVDALRVLLSGHNEFNFRLFEEDINKSHPDSDIRFDYKFKNLTTEEEADFLPALVLKDEVFEAHFYVLFTKIGAGRLKIVRWCGKSKDVGITTDMLENLRGVYLPPLRNASQDLKPGRNSQLSHLIQLLADNESKNNIEQELKKLDEVLKEDSAIADTYYEIAQRHKTMLGEYLSQNLKLDINGSDFKKFSARLSILADTLEIYQNGLGFNNLIYMAVVLCEMAKDPNLIYRGLIIEEPEAHLHPQLQAVLLEYLENIRPDNTEGELQVFVTSHSPNFASIAKLETITCLVESDGDVKVVHPRNITFEKNKKEKLERYLDVTRAELFFARKILFVEGTAELMLMNIFAKKLGTKYDLKKNAVSVISVDGLNFDCFLPLFGENGLPIPVSVLTDADPVLAENEQVTIYPDLNQKVQPSSNTIKMKELEDKFVKVFYGVKTFEYDFALYEKNRVIMLEVLEELHSKIADSIRGELKNAHTNQEKAKILFCGMFERGKTKTNVKKGVFGQALAQKLSHNNEYEIPSYITDALQHICIVTRYD